MSENLPLLVARKLKEERSKAEQAESRQAVAVAVGLTVIITALLMFALNSSVTVS